MFSAIVTCHNSDPNPVIRMLRRQTFPPDEILVETSGECAPIEEPVDHWDHVPDEHDFGYRKRNRMALFAKGDWIGFFCHDDSYHPRYIELMSAVTEDNDIVFCDWNEVPANCSWEPTSSTLGNFITRREKFLADGGFPVTDGDAGYADARYILNSFKSSRVHVPIVLYYHNTPYAQHINPTSWGETHEYETFMKERHTYSTWKYVTDQQLNAMLEDSDA